MCGIGAARRRALHYATRNPAFAKLQTRHLEYFATVLREPCPRKKKVGKIVTQPEKIAHFNRDWMNQVEGQCPAVLLPTSTHHVAAILRYCQEEKIAVVPQCGNTGLVYGSSALHDEVILSLQEMNADPVISQETMSAEAEAGVVLEHLQNAASVCGLLVPLTMGSKGSAQVGGTVSTNAGGIHFARYGSMHANVLGLEVVTPKGDVLDMISTLRKDNAGYDLKHLFIGTEGTLGVVTRTVMKLYPSARSTQLALFRLSTFDAVLGLYYLAQEHLAECLSAFEVMDGESLLAAPQEELPFIKKNKSSVFRAGGDYSSAFFCVLVETSGSNAEHDIEKLTHFVEAAARSPCFSSRVDDGDDDVFDPILSQSEAQTARLWKLRESTPVRLSASGVIYKFDISFPLDKFYIVVEHFRKVLYKDGKFDPDEVVVVGYGHFGDGNVHLNIVDQTRRQGDALEASLFPAVYEFCATHSGSISAEHGIGAQKKAYLGLSRRPEVITLMRSLKQMMDPNGILNPYKRNLQRRHYRLTPAALSTPPGMTPNLSGVLQPSSAGLPTPPTLPEGHDGSGKNGCPASSSQGQRAERPERFTDRGSSATYKTNRRSIPDIKVRRRAPWGMQQLRDSWSTDAMTKGDGDNMSERIHREYRYHPDEFRRNHIKFAAFMTIPAILFGASSSYYYHTGRPIWEADPQYILNMIRQMDTSPRSKLHPYELEGTEELPEHVSKYREKNRGRRLLLDGHSSDEAQTE